MADGLRNCVPSMNLFNPKVGDLNKEGILVYGSFKHIVAVKMLWQPTVLCMVEATNSRVKCVRFHPSKHHQLASAGGDEVKIWSFEISTFFAKEEHAFPCVSAIEWSPSSSNILFVSHNKNVITKWNVDENSKEEFCYGNKSGEITIMACHTSQPVLAIGFKNGSIAVLDSCDFHLKQKLLGHNKELVNISWSIYSNEILTSSHDGTVRVWTVGDVETSRTVVIYKWTESLDGNYAPIALWHPTKPNTVLATTSSGRFGELDVGTEGEKEVVEYINGMREDNKTFAYVFSKHELPVVYTFSRDRILTLWNLKNNVAAAEMYTFRSHVKCLAFPHISTGLLGILAIASQDKNVTFWDTSSDRKVFNGKQFYNNIVSPVICLAWHPEKKDTIAIGVEDGSVAIIDHWRYSKNPTYCNFKHKEAVASLCWGPCSKITGMFPQSAERLALFSCGDGKIQIHFMDRSLNLYEVVSSDVKKYYNIISWKDDFSLLAAGSSESVIDIYKGDTCELLMELFLGASAIRILVWHPSFYLKDDQKIRSSLHSWLATYSVHDTGRKTKIILYDVQEALATKGIVDKSLKVLSDISMNVNCVAWSPHFEEQFAVASSDFDVSVWNAVSGQLLLKFLGHFTVAFSVAWSPINKDIVFSGSKSTVLTFNHGWLKKQQKNGVAVRKSGLIFHKGKLLQKCQESSDSDDDDESLKPETELPTASGKSPVTSAEPTPAATEEQFAASTEGVALADNDEASPVSIGGASTSGTEETSPAAATKEVSEEQPQDSSSKSSEKNKSVLPFLSAKFASQHPEKLLASLRMLDSYIIKRESNCGDDEGLKLGEGELQYLAAFGDKEAILRMIKTEVKKSEMTQSERIKFDAWWNYDISELVQQAIEDGTISDDLLNHVSEISRSRWRDVCYSYAKQLEKEGSYYKAVMCLLACHKTREAVILLKDKDIINALLLAKRYILDEEDSLLNEVKDSFKSQLLEGKFQTLADNIKVE